MTVALGPGRLGRISASGNVKERCSRQKEWRQQKCRDGKTQGLFGKSQMCFCDWRHTVGHQLMIVRLTLNARLAV